MLQGVLRQILVLEGHRMAAGESLSYFQGSQAVVMISGYESCPRKIVSIRNAYGGDCLSHPEERIMPSVPLASAARGIHHFLVWTYSKQVIRESQLSSSEQAGVPWTGRTKPSVPMDSFRFKPWPFFSDKGSLLHS